MSTSEQAVDIRELHSSAANRASIVSIFSTPFVRRSLTIIGIGVLNFLAIVVLGFISFWLIPTRTFWGSCGLEFVGSGLNALLMGPILLCASILVLVRQSLWQRALIGAVLLFFLGTAITLPGVTFGFRFEHCLAFWLCLVILIPLRALFRWSVHWSEQAPPAGLTGQFSLVDILSWTAAIATSIGFFRFVSPPIFSSRFAFYSFQAFIPLAATVVVSILCLRLMLSRTSRVKGSLWITLWALIAVLLGTAAMMIWHFFSRQWPWWYVLLCGLEALTYFAVLELSILSNAFALEWLGLRWSRPKRDMTHRE